MRIFSGIQPSGDPHIGNYSGGFRQYAQTQERGEAFFCIVDLHAITITHDPAALREGTLDIGAMLFATGLDPTRSTVFVQSHVTAHAEAAWLLSSVTSYGQLARMTQFKEKSTEEDFISAALFTYPALMAGDILLYRTDIVPIGEDQRQHLELARDIAQKFNNDYRESIVVNGYADGQFFPLPEPMIQGPATRVMSLRDGTKKMSKSDPSDLSRINMSDDRDTIARKIQKAKTDPEPLPSEEAGLEKRPEADNLVGIYAALADTTKEKVLSEFGGSQFSAFKKQLADLAVARVAPVNAEMQRLLGDPAEIDRILADGASKARILAAPILIEIKNIVGFIQS
jgi:tryptophanyl-tRNA synthetase